MLKYYEFCPKCQGIRSMSVSIALKKVTGSSGLREILVNHYYCDTCSSFVFSQSSAEEAQRQPARHYVTEPAGSLH
jgi:hypothetical protein